MKDGVLIETLWNVNCSPCRAVDLNADRVLIETLWNVNLITTELCIKVLPVLIETLWNVNVGVVLVVDLSVSY